LKGKLVEAILIVLGLVVLVAIVGVVSYNRFVSQRNLIKDAWSNIDTELKRRYDLIPNLVETVKGYASHEKEIFEEVARTRSMAAGATGSPAEQAAAEGPLVAALGKLFAVVENYPDLKANQNFLELQRELTNTEDRLQTARRFYNGNVREYNERVKQFPSVLVASMFGFKEEEFFEVEEAVREGGPPQVDFETGAPTQAGSATAGSAPTQAGSAPPPPPADDVPEPPGQGPPPTPTS
jgi:LemA protein